MCKNMRRYESYLYSLQRFFVIQARVDRVGILQTVKPDTNDSQRDYAISQKMSHISKEHSNNMYPSRPCILCR